MPGKKEKARLILQRLEAEYPRAQTRLNFRSPFELLVATILSAQSTDEQVNRVTAGLFKHCNTPEKMAFMSQEELEELIKGCGLYKAKAKNLIAAARLLLERYNGEVPDSLEELIKLPGVGRKTANVVLSVGFSKPGLGVDTHVHRVANRLGLAKSKNPDKTEFQLKSLWPPEKWGTAHHVLIWHGRSRCRARRPDCTNCVVADLCSFKKTEEKS